MRVFKHYKVGVARFVFLDFIELGGLTYWWAIFFQCFHVMYNLYIFVAYGLVMSCPICRLSGKTSAWKGKEMNR